MRGRLSKGFVAFILALAFMLNGGAMQAARAHSNTATHATVMTEHPMPCHKSGAAKQHHPCCPGHSEDKAACTADCCTSVVPLNVEAVTHFSFVTYKPWPRPVL